MADTLTIDKLTTLIEQHSEQARNAVEGLENLCQQDKEHRTPLNVAIQFANDEITQLLIASSDAINYFPKIDDNLLAPVKHTVSAMFDGKNIEPTENHLKKAFGERVCWQRTPLHTACRYANLDAIALLVSRGADLKAKDILGLTPLELCVQFGGSEGVNRLIASCAEHKKKLPVTETALRMVCHDTDLYERLIDVGTLDNKAKRFAFNLACARLDEHGMDHMLSQNLDINKTMNDEFSPILEICTSRLLTFCEHPDAPRLAGEYAAASGNATGAIHIDNDAILNAESMEDIEKLFGDAFDEADGKKAEQASYALSDEERRSQLSQRRELIEYLVEKGLDIGIAEDKAPYGFLGEIVNTNAPELLQTLADKGFSLGPEKGEEDTEVLMALSKGQYKMVDPLLQLGHKWKRIKSDHPVWAQGYSDWKKQHASEVFTLELGKRIRSKPRPHKPVKAIRESKWTWELAGESVLLAETDPKKPKHDKPVTVRLTHSNVYGPVDGVKLLVRIGQPDKPTAFEDLDSGDNWQPMNLVEELLSVDGEEVDRSTIKEPVYGETPWDATYECELSLPKGKHSIEIKLLSEINGMSGVISDWLVNVS